MFGRGRGERGGADETEVLVVPGVGVGIDAFQADPVALGAGEVGDGVAIGADHAVLERFDEEEIAALVAGQRVLAGVAGKTIVSGRSPVPKTWALAIA